MDDQQTVSLRQAPPGPVESIAFPADAPPTLWGLRGDLEAVRAEARRVELLVQRGELVEAATAEAGLFDEARRLRDGWVRVGESLGLRARLLQDQESFKAAAVQELSRAGVLASRGWANRPSSSGGALQAYASGPQQPHAGGDRNGGPNGRQTKGLVPAPQRQHP